MKSLMYELCQLLFKHGYDVMVVTDDDRVAWLATRLGCNVVAEQHVENHLYDYVFSVHWHKFIR